VASVKIQLFKNHGGWQISYNFSEFYPVPNLLSRYEQLTFLVVSCLSNRLQFSNKLSNQLKLNQPNLTTFTRPPLDPERM
jgi:hypothetical protein